MSFHQAENSRHCTRTHFTTTVTSGALMLRLINGIESTRKFDQVHEVDVGTYPPRSSLFIAYDRNARMAMWKHYIFLFGGFYDPGIRSMVAQRYMLYTLIDYDIE